MHVKDREDAHIVRTYNGASPRAHIDIISVIHSIAYSTIPNSLFSTFKFLQQSEISGNYKNIEDLK